MRFGWHACGHRCESTVRPQIQLAKKAHACTYINELQHWCRPVHAYTQSIPKNTTCNCCARRCVPQHVQHVVWPCLSISITALPFMQQLASVSGANHLSVSTSLAGCFDFHAYCGMPKFVAIQPPPMTLLAEKASSLRVFRRHDFE
jgi:hypothetical protein